MGKKTSVATYSSQAIVAPHEAPATPMKHTSSSTIAPLPKTTSPFIGVAKARSARTPSAATLEGPFSSLDIADAREPESDNAKAQDPSSVRRASITKTRTGKPMDEQTVAKADDSFKRTRRGGKARKKEVAAQERRNGNELNGSPDTRKGYLTLSFLATDIVLAPTLSERLSTS
jgi:enhancer of mRNA-decapping protein 3